MIFNADINRKLRNCLFVILLIIPSLVFIFMIIIGFLLIYPDGIFINYGNMSVGILVIIIFVLLLYLLHFDRSRYIDLHWESNVIIVSREDISRV